MWARGASISSTLTTRGPAPAPPGGPSAPMERIASTTEAALVAVGFTRRKAEYAVGLARSELDLHELAALDDDEVRARITGLRGLGPWTADWFLARDGRQVHARRLHVEGNLGEPLHRVGVEKDPLLLADGAD